MNKDQASVGICYQYLDRFNEIYEDGKNTNDPPDNVRITIFCKSTKEEGFLINTTTAKAGLTLLIARKWILHSELEKIAKKKIN